VFVFVTRVALVSVRTSRTVAFASTAPDESVTCPRMEADPCASAPTDHIPTAKIVANTVADLILSPAQDQVPSPTTVNDAAKSCNLAAIGRRRNDTDLGLVRSAGTLKLEEHSVLGGMKLSRSAAGSAAALNILQVCREWTERVSRQVKGGMG
jgi:hypothetical protein